MKIFLCAMSIMKWMWARHPDNKNKKMKGSQPIASHYFIRSQYIRTSFPDFGLALFEKFLEFLLRALFLRPLFFPKVHNVQHINIIKWLPFILLCKYSVLFTTPFWIKVNRPQGTWTQCILMIMLPMRRRILLSRLKELKTAIWLRRRKKLKLGFSSLFLF